MITMERIEEIGKKLQDKMVDDSGDFQKNKENLLKLAGCSEEEIEFLRQGMVLQYGVEGVSTVKIERRRFEYFWIQGQAWDFLYSNTTRTFTRAGIERVCEKLRGITVPKREKYEHSLAYVARVLSGIGLEDWQIVNLIQACEFKKAENGECRIYALHWQGETFPVSDELYSFVPLGILRNKDETFFLCKNFESDKYFVLLNEQLWNCWAKNRDELEILKEVTLIPDEKLIWNGECHILEIEGGKTIRFDENMVEI